MNSLVLFTEFLISLYHAYRTVYNYLNFRHEILSDCYSPSPQLYNSVAASQQQWEWVSPSETLFLESPQLKRIITSKLLSHLKLVKRIPLIPDNTTLSTPKLFILL